MSDAIQYCKNCETQQMCHTERKCMKKALGSLRLVVGDVVEYKMSNGVAYRAKLANVESVQIARESLLTGRCKKVMPAEENPNHHT